MAIGDQVGKQAVDDVAEKVIPQAEISGRHLIAQLLDGLNAIADRLDGATITVTIALPPREKPLGFTRS